MPTSHFSLLLYLSLFLFTSSTTHSKPTHTSTSPYLSPAIFHANYHKMLQSFKIYIYTLPTLSPTPPLSPLENFFLSSLQNSPFLTHDPNQAYLFFLPFPSSLPTRSLARLIHDLRTNSPFWDRTLGADHFYVSLSGLAFASNRNLVELKKNSIQLSIFPSPEARFVPHKDITFPPLFISHALENGTITNLCYVMHNAVKDTRLVEELRKESNFLTESESSDEKTLAESLSQSDFCLFEYGADASRLGHALRSGCVPVIITDRPMQDLPLMDVLRWEEIAVFVRSGVGGGGLRSFLKKLRVDGTCERMRSVGVEASKHFVWNESPMPYDAFYSVMYQLWVRRHTIRYGRKQDNNEFRYAPTS